MAAVLQIDLVAGQVVVADVLVLLQRRRQQDERPRGVLADQAQRGSGPAERRDEHLDPLRGRRHLPGDLGAEAAVEPDLVRQAGEQRRQLVAAAIGQRQQLLHHRAEDLLPERLREQVADQEEEAARRCTCSRVQPSRWVLPTPRWPWMTMPSGLAPSAVTARMPLPIRAAVTAWRPSTW